MPKQTSHRQDIISFCSFEIILKLFLIFDKFSFLRKIDKRINCTGLAIKNPNNRRFMHCYKKLCELKIEILLRRNNNK